MLDKNCIKEEITRPVQTGHALTDADHEPRALSARYDEKQARIVIELDNACLFTFPTRLAQGLETADIQALADIELLGDGYAPHWPRVNTGLSVEGAQAGMFGSRKWMQRLAAHSAGSRISEQKATAARENGKKAGDPKRRRWHTQRKAASSPSSSTPSALRQFFANKNLLKTGEECSKF